MKQSVHVFSTFTKELISDKVHTVKPTCLVCFQYSRRNQNPNTDASCKHPFKSRGLKGIFTRSFQIIKIIHIYRDGVMKCLGC